MATGDFLKTLGSDQRKDTGTTLTLTVPAGGVTAGNTVFLVVALRSGTVASVADSGGNAYAVDVSRAETDRYGAIVRGAIVTALAENDTIVVTLSASTSGHGKVVVGAEYEGEATLDQSAHSAQSNSTTVSAGPVTTTSAVQTLIGGLAAGGPEEETYAADAPWVERVKDGTTGGTAGTNARALLADRNVSSVDNYSFSATVQTQRILVGVIATYEFASTPPPGPEIPEQALALGNNASASAPDTASLRITGDLDLRIWVNTDWTIDQQEFIGRFQGPSQHSYLFHMPGGRNLSLFLSPDGLSGTVVQASRQLPAGVVGDPLQVRVTWRASDGRVQFFYLDGETWTQVGTDATLNIGAIHAGTAPLTIGSSGSPLQGHVFTAEVRDGIDGTIVASPDFTEDGPWLVGDDSNTSARNDGQSNPWSLNGTAVIVSFVPGPHVFFDLTDMPINFETADSAEITVRTRGVNIDTPITLYAQIFQSDEVTPLSDEVEVVSETVDSSFTNHNVAFTGLNTAADKATWDAARIRFRWET